MGRVFKGELHARAKEESEEVTDSSDEDQGSSKASPKVLASMTARKAASPKKAPVSPPPRNYTIAEAVSKLLLILEGAPQLSVAHMRALGKVLARSPDAVKALARVFLHWSEAQDTYGDSSSRASSKLARALAQLLDGEITISLESSDEEE
eukprot:1916881-Rhodomonas_salina.1